MQIKKVYKSKSTLLLFPGLYHITTPVCLSWYNQVVLIVEGDLIFWDYKNNSLFVRVVAWKNLRPWSLGAADNLIGGFELENSQNPIFFYAGESTIVCKNFVDKNYQIKDVDKSKVILRNDEVLITLQDLFIESKLIGHKVLLGDTKKWILAGDC